MVLSVVFMCAGVAALSALALNRLNGAWAPWASLFCLWGGLGSAVGFAFVRARPAGLLRLRPIDLLWGIGLGLTLRLLVGVASSANSLPFPTMMSTNGGVEAGYPLPLAITAVVFGPVVEEMFFRAVVVVLLYQLLRRSLGPVVAAAVSLTASSAGFVCLHAVSGALDLTEALMLLFLSMACGSLVLLTGRIWGAVILHAVFNATFVILALLGDALTGS